MKKLFFALCMTLVGISANAQFTVPKETAQEAPRRKALFEKKSKKTIDPKYLEGAVPEVNGKIQWDKTLTAEGKTAQQIYDNMLTFLQTFVKGSEMTQYSRISVVNKTEFQIGARIQEWLVFENKPLSLDRTKFNYQIIVNCSNGKCDVTLRNLSYVYEEERGGGQFPAEEKISDSEALNKKKDGFLKGGAKKFRTKTIDRVEAVFASMQEAINK